MNEHMYEYMTLFIVYYTIECNNLLDIGFAEVYIIPSMGDFAYAWGLIATLLDTPRAG